MAPGNPALAGWGPFNPHWRLQVDRFQRDIVYRRPSTRRHSILRYITRVAAFPLSTFCRFVGDLLSLFSFVPIVHV